MTAVGALGNTVDTADRVADDKTGTVTETVSVASSAPQPAPVPSVADSSSGSLGVR